jgi:hypothetical protein
MIITPSKLTTNDLRRNSEIVQLVGPLLTLACFSAVVHVDVLAEEVVATMVVVLRAIQWSSLLWTSPLQHPLHQQQQQEDSSRRGSMRRKRS